MLKRKHPNLLKYWKNTYSCLASHEELINHTIVHNRFSKGIAHILRDIMGKIRGIFMTRIYCCCCILPLFSCLVENGASLHPENVHLPNYPYRLLRTTTRIQHLNQIWQKLTLMTEYMIFFILLLKTNLFLPKDCRTLLLLLNTLATPASERTCVSAHCFSAVSLEWCIRMFPPFLDSFVSEAWLEIFFTWSSMGKRTCKVLLITREKTLELLKKLWTGNN